MNCAFYDAMDYVLNAPENQPIKNTTLFPSVCSRTNRYDANKHKAVGDFGNVRNERLFLLSKKEKYKNNRGNKKRSKTKNRKYKSTSATLKINGVDYAITSPQYGYYPIILKKAVQQLDICLGKWVRVFGLRFDLHQKHYKKTSADIRRFIKNLKRRIEREYDISNIAYCWVREQERAKSQHYHFVIFLDGNKIRHSSKILKMIESTWKNIAVGNHMPVIKNPFYFIDNETTKADLIERISYLAKTRGKGYKGKNSKDYSTSRLTPTIKINKD